MIRVSIASSLHSFRSFIDTQSPDDSYIDALPLHSAYLTMEETLEVWSVLSTHNPHRIRVFRILNVQLPVRDENNKNMGYFIEQFTMLIQDEALYRMIFEGKNSHGSVRNSF